MAVFETDILDNDQYNQTTSRARLRWKHLIIWCLLLIPILVIQQDVKSFPQLIIIGFVFLVTCLSFWTERFAFLRTLIFGLVVWIGLVLVTQGLVNYFDLHHGMTFVNGKYYPVQDNTVIISMLVYAMLTPLILWPFAKMKSRTIHTERICLAISLLTLVAGYIYKFIF